MTKKNNDYSELESMAHDVIALQVAFEYEVKLIDEYKAIMVALRQQLTNVSHVVQSGRASIYIDPTWNVRRLGAMVSLLMSIAGGAPFTLREEIESTDIKTDEKKGETITEVINIKDATERKALVANARNAATALMIELNINPEQNQLPFVLGIPEAKDNAQAISEWILRQSKSSKIDNDSYRSLRLKLMNILEDCQGGY